MEKRAALRQRCSTAVRQDHRLGAESILKVVIFNLRWLHNIGFSHMNISNRLNFQITSTSYGKMQSMKCLLTEENIARENRVEI